MLSAAKILSIVVSLFCVSTASMNLCTTCECDHRLGTVTCRNPLDKFEDISFESWVDHVVLTYCPTSPALLKDVYRRATIETNCPTITTEIVYQHIHIRPPTTSTSSPPAQYSSTESCSTTIEPATPPRPSSTQQPLRFTVAEPFSTSLKTTTATPSKQPHSTSSPRHTTAMKLLSTGGGSTMDGLLFTPRKQSTISQASTPHPKPTTPRYMRTTTRRYMRTTTRKPPRRRTTRRRVRTTTNRPKTQATTRRRRLSKPKRPTSTPTPTTTTTTNAVPTLGEINETRHVNDRKHRAHSESDLQQPQSPQTIEIEYEAGSLIYWMFVAVGVLLILSVVGNVVLAFVVRAHRLTAPPVILLEPPEPNLMGFDTPSHAAAAGVSGDPNV